MNNCNEKLSNSFCIFNITSTNAVIITKTIFCLLIRQNKTLSINIPLISYKKFLLANYDTFITMYKTPNLTHLHQ
jgi:hypothetical protein